MSSKKPPKKAGKDKPESNQNPVVTKPDPRVKPSKGTEKPQQIATADQAKPIKPGSKPKGTPKRGVPKRPGERGPDKKKRKTRSDKKPDPVQPPADPAQTDPVPVDPSVARMTAEGAVETIDMVFAAFLPPSLRKEEKEKLIQVWTPVLEMYADSLGASPWVPALTVTGMMVLPRIYAKFAAKSAK